MIVLLIGGIVAFCVGVLAIVFGIPIKEFSFGNTMILTGSIVSSTGLILMGLYFVGRELRQLVRRLEVVATVPTPLPVAMEEAVEDAVMRAEPPQRPSRERDALFVHDQRRRPEPPPSAVSVPDRPPYSDQLPEAEEPSPSWRDHPLSRSRESMQPSSLPVEEEPASAPAEPADRPRRRNIMFASHRRDQKGRGSVFYEEPPGAEISPPHEESVADESPQPEPEPPPMSQDPTFDTSWRRSNRLRPEPPSTRFAPAPDALPVRERAPPSPVPEPPAVTVVKSGVVDSMAYSLYSDGSIEAQMPEGMVRFASIEELRAHLDQRG